MIPMFLVCVNEHILILKNRNFERKFIILCSIIFPIPIIYALSVSSNRIDYNFGIIHPYFIYDKIDLEHEKEAFEISKIVYLETQRINLYGPKAKFIPVHRFYELESFQS